MASDGSDQDARYALSKLLQRGTVVEYESEFLMLIKRVTGISESLLKSFYISRLKPLLQCALLRLAPTTLGEAFSIARIMESRFETIAGKRLNIEEKMDTVLSWPSEEAPPVIKGSLDANEDIGVVEVSSAIDDVFDIGESNVESMEVRSEFSEFSENKKSVKEVVVGGGETLGVDQDESNRVILVLMDRGGEFDDSLDEINQVISEEFVIRVLEGRDVSGEVFSVTPWAAEGGRMVLCYVRCSGRQKRKKGVGCGSGRQENYGSRRRVCCRIKIWDPGIKRVFQANTLRTK
ncbi:hypothetical protein Tco_0880670 [Tanacetum coccineum]